MREPFDVVVSIARTSPLRSDGQNVSQQHDWIRRQHATLKHLFPEAEMAQLTLSGLSATNPDDEHLGYIYLQLAARIKRLPGPSRL